MEDVGRLLEFLAKALPWAFVLGGIGTLIASGFKKEAKKKLDLIRITIVLYMIGVLLSFLTN